MQLDIDNDKTLQKVEAKQRAEIEKRERLRQSTSFRLMEGVATYMDQYYLDPILGLLSGVGDFISTLSVTPFIYYTIVHVRSIPLTLAVIFNALKDAAIGMIPFWIGDILDVFHKSNVQNLNLIIGYVNGEPGVKSEVNRKAIWSAIGIVVCCIVIYFLVTLVAGLIKSVF